MINISLSLVSTCVLFDRMLRTYNDHQNVLPRRTLYNYYLYYISLQLRETILKRQYVTNLLTEPLLEMLPHLRHDLAAEEVQEYDTHSKGESQTKI